CDEDGNDTPEPFPTLPTKPAALAGNANAAAVQIHKDAMQRFNDVTQALKEVRKAVLASLGGTITTALKGLPGGLRAQKLPEILLYLEQHHGTFSADDIRNLARKCRAATFTTPATFPADAAQLHLLCTQLAKIGPSHAIPALEQIDILWEGTRTMPSIQTCIADYEKKCIDAEPRTTGNYADLVTHVIAHAPRVTTSSVGYSGAMVTPPTAPPLLTEREQGYAAGLQTAALQAAGRGGGGRGGGHQAQGRSRGRGDSAPAPLRAYCFVHGTRGHTGAQCRTMAKGAPETHPSFTDEMRAATGPCTIDGYPGASVKA
ncbi:hypothetical protein B484DRAFT_456821, partial [Ochromonadaceae sp. CCMP2298]